MRDALGTVQSVLVLGGASEIARATVRDLIAEGSERIVLAGRHPDRLERAAMELRGRGATVETATFDADDVESHAAFFDALASSGRDIDVVLVAAGVLGDGRVHSDNRAAARLLHTNFVGAASAMLAAADALGRQGHGTIVVLSSVAGERVRKSNFVYGSSKAGLDGFAQGLGDSLEHSGVDVVVVRPGFVHTAMTAGLSAPPLSSTPDDVARAIVGALRERRRTVWVPPLLRWVMAVFRHLPAPVWRRMPI